MALIPLGSGRFADDPDRRRGINAMRHQNSVFHGLLKYLPWGEFDRLVAVHRADSRVRRLTTKSQFMALLYGQLSGASSLREIVAGLQSHEARRYHLGARAVPRSTLADANAHRPSGVFTELFALMVSQANRHLRRALGDTVYLIDSTGLKLDRRSAAWARFSDAACGAKVHVVYDPDGDRPVYAVVTAASVNDITPAKAMPIEPGATYVFDLGYYDYDWWAKLDRAQCRIVTRFKSNTPLAVVEELPVSPGTAILSDRIGHLPRRQSNNRPNPFQDPVREVRVQLDTGKVLRILSNDLDARADRRALQAPLGDRTVLPLDQAEPQDPPLSRHQQKRRAHPDRRRPDRLSAAAHGSGSATHDRQPTRLRPARARQSDASPTPRPSASNRAAAACQSGSIGAPMEPNLNRTPVLCRAGRGARRPSLW
jgi:hypothetical protein